MDVALDPEELPDICPALIHLLQPVLTVVAVVAAGNYIKFTVSRVGGVKLFYCLLWRKFWVCWKGPALKDYIDFCLQVWREFFAAIVSPSTRTRICIGIACTPRLPMVYIHRTSGWEVPVWSSALL